MLRLDFGLHFVIGSILASLQIPFSALYRPVQILDRCFVRSWTGDAGLTTVAAGGVPTRGPRPEHAQAGRSARPAVRRWVSPRV